MDGWGNASQDAVRAQIGGFRCARGLAADVKSVLCAYRAVKGYLAVPHANLPEIWMIQAQCDICRLKFS
jgi:hypothetical protein